MNYFDNAHALLIGVGGHDMEETVNDATAIHNILADKSIAGYKNINLLTEEKATRQGILDALDQIAQNSTKESAVLIYYSGHGGFNKEINQYFLVPNDFDFDEHQKAWVKAEEINKKLSALKTKQLILLLDCCHAAGINRPNDSLIGIKSESELSDAEALVKKIEGNRDISIVSSCQANQKSWVLGGEINSLFTTCLIEVLRGKHKEGFDESFITITEVIQHLLKEVPKRAAEVNRNQRPFANISFSNDFVLSVVNDIKNNDVLNSEISTFQEGEKNKSKNIINAYKDSPDAKNVVIFVHGFTGEATNTFGKLPLFLAEDDRMSDWNLYPMGYNQYVKPYLGKHVWASVDDISRIADNLRASIEYKFDKYEKIAIVAHGLGGLVAQRALIDLKDENLERISHFIMCATPSNGIENNTSSKIWMERFKNLNKEEKFISTLRKDWDDKFNLNYSFDFKIVAGTQDMTISNSSIREPFADKHYVSLIGDHYSIVQPESADDLNYLFILKTLSNPSQHDTYLDNNEIDIVKDSYQEVIESLYPKIDSLDKRGLEKLTFSLEGLDRGEEALNILKNHVLVKNNTDLLGIIGGRLKRLYLNSFENKLGLEAIEYYNKAFKMASKNKNIRQIYYHGINLAFLHLIVHEDYEKMKSFAKKALKAAKSDPIDSLWKLATLGEGNIYLGKFEKAISFYKKSKDLAGRREKISIHTNAYAAYCTLLNTNNPKNEFIEFLNESFLN